MEARKLLRAKQRKPDTTNGAEKSSQQLPAAPKGIDVRIRGQRFGHLVAEYSDHTGRRVALRCVCQRLTFVAAAELASGAITSCGCKPRPATFHEQQVGLWQQVAREIDFNSEKASPRLVQRRRES